MKQGFVARLAVLLVMSIIFPAQAAVPLAAPDQDRRAREALPPNGRALLFIYRAADDADAEVPVHINGRFVGRTAPGTYLLFSLEPGRHALSTDGRKQDVLPFNAEVGKNYFVRQEARPDAGEERASFSLVSTATGRYAIASARLIDARAAQAARAPAPPPVARTPAPPAREPVSPATRQEAAVRKTPAAAPGEQGGVSLSLRLGSFRLGDSAQSLAGIPIAFDDASSGVYSLDGEWRQADGTALGLEAMRYRNDLAGPAATSGEMGVTLLFANMKRYWRFARDFSALAGIGVGVAITDFTGSVVTGNTSGVAVQLIAGLEYRLGDTAILLDARHVSASTEDSAGQNVKVGGRGLFAGLSWRF